MQHRTNSPATFAALCLTLRSTIWCNGTLNLYLNWIQYTSFDDHTNTMTLHTKNNTKRPHTDSQKRVLPWDRLRLSIVSFTVSNMGYRIFKCFCFVCLARTFRLLYGLFWNSGRQRDRFRLLNPSMGQNDCAIGELHL